MKNINSLIACVCFFLSIGIQPIFSQVIIEGYAFESGNRGFLNEVFVEVFNAETNELISRTRSSTDGKFELTAPAGKSLLVKGSKDLFHETELAVSTLGKSANDKVFVKLEMNRAPGYIFDITMAEKREDEEKVVDAIRGALVEVYNNTTREPMLVLDDHPHPDFRIDLEKGNHYTIMIRKEGYLAKRMEAFVNVKGCILCFEGIGEVQPGVSDNLTEGNQMGTLLANVELEKLYTGKKITLNNIYYDYGRASIKKDAVEELENAVTFLMDNPRINVELSSHTDSRGKSHKNQALSEKRARNTVEWLMKNSELPSNRVVARGYGETKLLNKCDDSADCTEAQHAINRRTEFKVLSISAPTEPFKSLEKIKLEENMDDIIAELQNEGQVKVTDEAELEKIKEEGINKNEIEENKQKVKSSESKVEPMIEKKVPNVEIEENEPIATAGDVSIQNKETPDPTEVASTAANMSIEEVNEAVIKETKINEAAVVSEDLVKEAKSVEAPLVDQAKTIESSKIDKATTVDEKVNEVSAIEETTTEDLNVTVSKAEQVEAAQRLNTIGDFTGYKYVIHFSGTALPDNHQVYSDHDKLDVLQTGSSNFLYMIGDYATEVYAKSGLSTIKKKYPDAYVIGFKNGERIE